MRRSFVSSFSAAKYTEWVIVLFLWVFSCVSILTTLGITWILLTESLGFFSEIKLQEFLLGQEWYPLIEPRKFGVLPLICGTLLVALGAALMAIPLGSLTAIYLSEYAGDKSRAVLKPALEMLSGVPTVVYGYLAITYVTPMLQAIWPATQVFNALSASIVVAIMILPMIASLSDDAMRAVPKSLRFGAFALGATEYDVSTKVVFPAALSGITASYVLAISRAIGETMAVTLAAGATPKMTWNPLESVQTLTGYIVQVSMGDTPSGTIEYQSIFAVGLVLFFMTFIMNFLAQNVLQRFRQKYE